MIRLIDNLFAAWAPHDIMWYSWCIMALLILLGWAIGAGIRNRHRMNVYRRTERHGHSYDIPMWEENGNEDNTDAL